MFGDGFTDILSGYRVLSRRFAKSFPVSSAGFEIEVELLVHALDLKIATGEMALPYGTRPDGSTSKRTYRDGLRILLMLFKLYKETQPPRFFGAAGTMLLLVCLGSASRSSRLIWKPPCPNTNCGTRCGDCPAWISQPGNRTRARCRRARSPRSQTDALSRS